MTPTHETPAGSELYSDAKPNENHNGFTASSIESPIVGGPAEETPETAASVMPEESPLSLDALQEAARRGKEALKAAEKKKEKSKLKEKKSSTKILAAAFPMVELIDEQVRTSIPQELVAKVKGAKSKRHIISSNYPYRSR